MKCRCRCARRWAFSFTHRASWRTWSRSLSPARQCLSTWVLSRPHHLFRLADKAAHQFWLTCWTGLTGLSNLKPTIPAHPALPCACRLYREHGLPGIGHRIATVPRRIHKSWSWSYTRAVRAFHQIRQPIHQCYPCFLFHTFHSYRLLPSLCCSGLNSTIRFL